MRFAAEKRNHFVLFRFLTGSVTKATWSCLQAVLVRLSRNIHRASVRRITILFQKTTRDKIKTKLCASITTQQLDRQAQTSRSQRLSVQKQNEKQTQGLMQACSPIRWRLYATAIPKNTHAARNFQGVQKRVPACSYHLRYLYKSPSTSLSSLLHPILDGRRRNAATVTARCQNKKKKHPRIPNSGQQKHRPTCNSSTWLHSFLAKNKLHNF